MLRSLNIISYLWLMTASLLVESADLAFRNEGDGLFSFDTGAVRGELLADDKSQGIRTLVHIETGMELAYGQNNPGVLSYYRVFSANKRWGDSARGWPKSAKLLPDGAVQVHWLSRNDHPFEMTAIYRWSLPDTLDLETIVKPDRDMEEFEVFLSSYFNRQFKSLVYVKRTIHAPGDPFFLPTDVNDLVLGTYLAFPRDRQAAQIIYDGRWDYEPHPVHFSVAKYLAYPLCMKRDAQSGITVVLMSRPGDCFAIETPYNMDPPDGIAGHSSMYMSLFGEDIKATQTVRACTRLIVRRRLSERDAISLYSRFINEEK
ncbi:hypothetical protein HQ563_13045 [bacterium]|nr:hypothetical protein [bacterium]